MRKIGFRCYKLGDSGLRWNQRYFVLEGGMLVHYLNPDGSGTPRRVIALENCQDVGEVVSRLGKYSFSIGVEHLARDYVLGFASKRDAVKCREDFLSRANAKDENADVSQNGTQSTWILYDCDESGSVQYYSQGLNVFHYKSQYLYPSLLLLIVIFLCVPMTIIMMALLSFVPLLAYFCMHYQTTAIQRRIVLPVCPELLLRVLLDYSPHRKEWDHSFTAESVQNCDNISRIVHSDREGIFIREFLKYLNTRSYSVRFDVGDEYSLDIEIHHVSRTSSSLSSASVLYLTSPYFLWPWKYQHLSNHVLYSLKYYLESLDEDKLSTINKELVLDFSGKDEEQDNEITFRELLAKKLPIFLNEIKDRATGYHQVLDTNDEIKVYKGDTSSSPHDICVKATGIINAPISKLLYYLSDITRKPEYDPMCSKGFIVKEYSNLTKTVCQQFHSIWPISRREFYHVVSMFRLEDDQKEEGDEESFVILTTSIPGGPVDGKHVRCSIRYGGYRLDSLEQGTKTRLTFNVLSDMKTSLPAFIKDMSIKDQGLQIRRLRGILSADVNSLANEEVIKEWYGQMIRSLDTVESGGNISAVKDKKGMRVFPSEYSGNIAKYSDLIEQGFQKAIRACSNDGWELTNTINDVHIYKNVDDSGFSQFKGIGIINSSAMDVVKLLNSVEHKSVYEPMFKEGRLVERLDRFTKIVHDRYKAIWPLSGRDFCKLTAFRAIPGKSGVDDLFLIFSKSVLHEDCPEVSGSVRGSVRFGCVVCKSIGDGSSCQVTYTSNIDLNGNIPSSIMNRLATQQPLIIHRLRTILMDPGFDCKMLPDAYPESDGVSVEKEEIDLFTEDYLQGVSNELLELMGSLDDWEELYENNQTKVSGIRGYKNKTLLIKSTSMNKRINGSLSNIAHVLLHKREWYDSLCNSSKISTRIDDFTFIQELEYDSLDLCPEPGQVQILVRYTYLNDGSLFILYTNNHEQVSELDWSIHIGGWLIIPVDTHHYNVTSIISIPDNKPKWVKSTLVKQQPLNIKHLASLFRQ